MNEGSNRGFELFLLSDKPDNPIFIIH